MTEQEIDERAEQALMYYKKGYNCAQAVACAFSDLTELDETTLFKLTEGLGHGMGSMAGTCGAISAAAILSGLTHSTGNLDSPNSKADTGRVSKACLNDFKAQNGSVTCRELKGIDTKKVLRSCNGCIEDAVKIIGHQLFENAK